ncbi:MAG: cytochrome c [Thermoleophilaceae bacterium]|nr:cytochrome c [Thermoleophilaceae bacterium]
MTRPLRIATGLATVSLIALAGCGSEIEVPKEEKDLRAGAELFNERCSGCHSFEAANSFGSNPDKTPLKYQERTNGPNFNVRKEDKQSVLYAIRNGGFSGAIMPANIVVGDDAELVADFVEEYAGRKPESTDESGSDGFSTGNQGP